jgi:hypothetical protein
MKLDENNGVFAHSADRANKPVRYQYSGVIKLSIIHTMEGSSERTTFQQSEIKSYVSAFRALIRSYVTYSSTVSRIS